MTENLKPCPFCNGKAELFGGFDGLYQVICTQCNGTIDALSDKKEEVVAAWNARPIEDEKDSEIKRLREALEHVTTTGTTVDEYGIWHIDGKTFQTWAANILKGKDNAG